MGQVNASTSRDRVALVNALADLSVGLRRRKAKSFLSGLSRDELRYIADFFGASILDPDLNAGSSRAAAAVSVERFEKLQSGNAVTMCCHKMILLLEFLSLTQLAGAFAARGGQA